MKSAAEAAFEARGLDAEVADRLGCRFENGMFAFEYRSMDVLSYTKYRKQDKSMYVKPSGVPPHLWGVDDLRELGSKPKDPLVITEGEFDRVAVYQTCGGFTTSVSVPNGSAGKKSEGAIYPDKDTGFRWLWGSGNKLIREVDQFDKIILATDDDEAGAILRDELAIRIGESRCWFVNYPEGCKDANDVLIQYGAETLAKVVKNAKPMRPGHLVKPSELPPRESIPTFSTGWPDLDPHIMLARPELFIVTGYPGAGKGQWVRALAFRLAVANGWKTAFFTPEDPHERLKRDMRRFGNAHIGNSAEVNQWMDRHFRISHPPLDERITIEMVMDEMEAAALHHDCQVFVLDPWNEVSHNRRGRTSDDYIEETLVDLKRRGRKLSLILVIAAHPKKPDSNGEKPDLYSISGSANWYNKCDHGVIIWRSTPDDKFAYVRIQKAKDHETMGRPGVVHMVFDASKADFTVEPA